MILREFYDTWARISELRRVLETTYSEVAWDLAIGEEPSVDSEAMERLMETYRRSMSRAKVFIGAEASLLFDKYSALLTEMQLAWQREITKEKTVPSGLRSRDEVFEAMAAVEQKLAARSRKPF